jgi:serine/threonine protein kinase/Flp pilus assembly protein TadD
MDPERWRRLWELFHDAREIAEERRQAFLRDRCADEPQLADEVLELLATHESSTSRFLETPPSIRETPELSPGDRLGPYRIVELIGSGGMGVVFLAEQEEPVRRRVALKLLRAGFDGGEFLARFDLERQVLARMNHPGIARVYDAGTTERGRPYLVMEYVDGRPIHRFADEHHMTTDQRVELFVGVCEAVQHAHQRGVIHRDLKPSNILVTEEGGRPAAKIIDFGVAKATDRTLSDGAPETELGQMIGTPEYMSPEQAGQLGGDIDTRTDVYSLGVVLYELLSGSQPFDADSLRRAGYEEIRRIIREQEPLPPSTRLGSLGSDTTEIAEHRDTDPPSLIRTIRGDLDWITMKALEKDRDRRYRSPVEFSEDLCRYREDRPVSARPPSAAYRTRKFVRRHRLGVTAAAIVTIGLVAGISVGAWGLVRALAAEREARSEAASAQRISDFLISLFEESDPEQSRGREVSAREVLDAGVERIETELADDPAVRARLLGTMGGVYNSLGEYERALELLEGERQLLEQLRGATHPDTLRTIEEIAIVYWYLERYDEAEPLLRLTMDSRLELFGPEHPDTVNVTSNLGILMSALGRHDEAEPLLRSALDGRRKSLGDEHLHTLSTMTSLANLLLSLGEFSESEALQLEALETVERVHGDDHPTATSIRNNLAVLYKSLGRPEDAERVYRSNLEIQRRVLGDEHVQSVRTINSLAEVLIAQERYDEAERLLEQNLETTTRVFGEGDHESLRALALVVQVAWETDRAEESRERVMRLIELRQQRVDDMPDNVLFGHELANLLLTCRPEDLRDAQRALPYAQAAVDGGSTNPFFQESLAVALHETGQRERAMETLRYAIELTDDDAGPLRTGLERRLADYEAGRSR